MAVDRPQQARDPQRRDGQAAPPARAQSGPPPDTAMPQRPRRSLARSLADEVERLRADLATTRARLAEMEARADTDALLDVLNRRGFERELTRALAYVRRYRASAALIYLDLDRFKPVNDAQGHAAGDAVLTAACGALVANVRASDTVARLSGDEFVVLLWNLDAAAAAAKAAALEAAVANVAVPWNGARLTISASAGFAMLGEDDGPASVLARADRAMYARKAERRTALR